MPEAVIVAATRSPIGRAYKGSLKGPRPDDLDPRPAERDARCGLETMCAAGGQSMAMVLERLV